MDYEDDDQVPLIGSREEHESRKSKIKKIIINFA